MTSPNKSVQVLEHFLSLFSRDDFCCVLMHADPDAMASALAVKRLLGRRTAGVTIAAANEITRPDNLAMIRCCRIPVVSWKKEMTTAFHKFIMVDSQPHHHPVFEKIHFTAVIDHHPVDAEHPVQAVHTDIRPSCGAASTILTRYLRAARIRPNKRLATALQYGIRTDTAAFERSGDEADLRAFQYLRKFSDSNLLRRVLRSEYLLQWLPVFSRAFFSLRTCGTGYYAYVHSVSNPDILVSIADFFTRVHDLKWVAVCGSCRHKAVIIFRGDGSRDIGRLASEHFQSLGSAGGHRNLARAEFSLEALPEHADLQNFVYHRLSSTKRIKSI